MEICLLAIGRTEKEFIKHGLEEFTARLKRYVPFSITLLPDTKSAKNLTPELQKEKEGDSLLKEIAPSDLCILLDERGREHTSREFAAFLEKSLASGRRRLVFVVGGPYGFARKVYDRADGMVSLSRMTFTHEMVRLFFTEQVYRAMTILRGEPYHHD